jgi:FKBP-type peptidyl-prolyl cis-trans isomerase 2
MTPYPGMIVSVNRLRGKVLSVSGGRVRVDFNHPLAGKTLRFDVEVVEIK